jgi:hypothetical protein
LIGRPGDGFRIAMSVLDVFRSTVGAAALGFARRALDESIKRVAERKLFAAPMAELQMVQGHIADMALDVDAAALLVYRAAWTKDVGAARVTREAAMAKLYATDRAQRSSTRPCASGGDGVRKGHIGKPYRETARAHHEGARRRRDRAASEGRSRRMARPDIASRSLTAHCGRVLRIWFTALIPQPEGWAKTRRLRQRRRRARSVVFVGGQVGWNGYASSRLMILSGAPDTRQCRGRACRGRRRPASPRYLVFYRQGRVSGQLQRHRRGLSRGYRHFPAMAAMQVMAVDRAKVEIRRPPSSRIELCAIPCLSQNGTRLQK